MTFELVLATELADDSVKLLQEAPDIVLKIVPPTVSAVREALRSADALIARDDLIVDRDLLEHAPQLKIIAHPTAALTNLDVDAATERGIMVMNTPGIGAVAVAEHTFALILAISRKLVEAHNSMKSGYWLMDRQRQAGVQLRGKTLGVIGLGRVGRQVAQLGVAFGMETLAFDPYLSEEHSDNLRVAWVGLRELLARSDYVTLHIPATQETQRMMNAERISGMKRGAFLINTAHGDAVDEEALATAIRSGHLAGAAVDVFDNEPPYNSPLIGLEGVIHTPHIADNTREAMQDLSIQVVQQVLDALRDIDYRNVVNMPLAPGVDYESIRPYLRLAERIGHLISVLTRYPVRRLAVEYRGADVTNLVKPLTVAMLKGLLQPILGDEVGYINAPVVASQRGIQVTQIKGLKTGDYANLVSCQVTLEDGEEIVMAGTLLDRKEPHIMQINEYRMNFVPEGHLLLMGSSDKPGVIGRVGTLMAENHINIASWHTGRAEPGGNTLTVLTLDTPLPEALLNELRAQDFVRHAHQVKL